MPKMGVKQVDASSPPTAFQGPSFVAFGLDNRENFGIVPAVSMDAMGRRKQRGLRTSGGPRKGQSLVEFAMVLPILVVLLFGIIQFGFIFAAYMTIRNATVIAARYAVLSVTNSPPTKAQIQDVAKQAVTPMLKISNVTAVNVDTNVTVGAAAGATSVQIVYNLPLIIPFVVAPGQDVPNTLTLSATTVMR